ncbi:CHAT domain-containing protein [bacterium]|nr:CHAT domain-containing protein [bacterium]
MAAEASNFILFNLSLQKSTSGYIVRADSPRGEVRSTFSNPLSAEDLIRLGQIRRLALLRVRDATMVLPDSAEVTSIGQRLFRSLFQEDILANFLACESDARLAESYVRVRLWFEDTPELENMPWEFLYHERVNHLALSTRTPLVRYLPSPNPPLPLAVSGAVKILVLISLPPGSAELESDREWDLIQRSLSQAQKERKVVLDRLDSPSIASLSQVMSSGSYHVLHYIGHGDIDRATGDGFLLMRGESDQLSRVGARDLARVVGRSASLRLVFLNACKGAVIPPSESAVGLAQTLVREGIPAVLAMNNDVSDQAASVLAHTFYTAVSERQPVDIAAANARHALRTRWTDGLEWGTPVLYMRSRDGILFRRKEKSRLSGIVGVVLAIVLLATLAVSYWGPIASWVIGLFPPEPPKYTSSSFQSSTLLVHRTYHAAKFADAMLVSSTCFMADGTHRSWIDTVSEDRRAYQTEFPPNTDSVSVSFATLRAGKPSVFTDASSIDTRLRPPAIDSVSSAKDSIGIFWRKPSLPVDAYLLKVLKGERGSGKVTLEQSLSPTTSALWMSEIYYHDLSPGSRNRVVLYSVRGGWLSQDSTQTTFVVPDKVETEREKPPPIPPPVRIQTANLTVNVDPVANARLFVGGIRRSIGEPITLDTGSYRIQIVHPDYPILEEVVRLTANDVKQYALAPEPGEVDTVRVVIGGDPPQLGNNSAILSINGKRRTYYTFPIWGITLQRGKWDIRFQVQTADGNITPADSVALFPKSPDFRKVLTPRDTIVDLANPLWRKPPQIDILLYW